MSHSMTVDSADSSIFLRERPQVEFSMASPKWYLPRVTFLPPCCSTQKLPMVLRFLRTRLNDCSTSPQARSLEIKIPRQPSPTRILLCGRRGEASGQELPLNWGNLKICEKETRKGGMIDKDPCNSKGTSAAAPSVWPLFRGPGQDYISVAGHIVWWTSLQRQCHTFRDIGNGCWSNLPPKAGDLGSMVSWPLYPLPLNPHLPAFTERIPSFLPPFLPFLPCSSLGSWLHFHCPEVCPSPICCPCCSLSVVHWLGIAVWSALLLP